MITFTLSHNKYYDVPENTEILELKSPGSCINPSNISSCTSLKSINVDNLTHWYFNSIDGILYTKDMKELIRCPIAKKGTVIIPEGVEEIAYHAFFLSDIEKVVFPSTLKRIKTEAFTRCSRLEKICFGAGITSIGGYDGSNIFSYCSSLTHIEFPSQLREIHRGAFQGCRNLHDIKLNDGLDLIDFRAFVNCALEEIHIPDSVTRLGARAFGDVKKIYSSRYISGMITAACKIAFNESVLELHINDDVMYLPKCMTEGHINGVEDMFTYDYGQRDFGPVLYSYAVDTKVKQYVAFKAYQKHPTKSLKIYLKRISKNLAETLISEGKHDDFISLLEADLMSDNTLKYVFELVQGNAVLSSYVMNKMKKTKDSGFSL